MGPVLEKKVKNRKALRFAHFLSALIVFGFFVALFAVQPSVAKSDKGPVYNHKYAALVMDADTGLILFQRNPDKTLHPASLTKVMTLLMVFDALEAKKISLNTRVRISKRAASMVPSKLDLPVGSTIRVKDAINILVTKSANDIAVALGEKLGGSEYGFARKMNRKARDIGMSRTIFKNASGLHHEGQVTTARDMVKMANYVIKKYPKYYRYFSKKSFNYRGKTYKNHNRLMSTYKGMDGMKTGYIKASGFNLVASARRDRRRLIGVVFGGRSGKSRNAHMAEILDKGFARLNGMTVAQKQRAPKVIQVAAVAQPARLSTRIKRPPLPEAKPPMAGAVAALTRSAPATGAAVVAKKGEPEYRWVSLDKKLKKEVFSHLIGEGDYDESASRRIETGLRAVSAVRGEVRPEAVSNPTRVPLSAPALQPAVHKVRAVQSSAAAGQISPKGWAIQVGAFSSRVATDQALYDALNKLPAKYKTASPSIAPLRAGDEWMFRARLDGYTRHEASKACSYIQDCLIVAPNG